MPAQLCQADCAVTLSHLKLLPLHEHADHHCMPMQFIYISREEMEAVAGFMKQKGRVAIAELAAKSSQFIDLEEKALQPAQLHLDLEEQESAGQPLITGAA